MDSKSAEGMIFYAIIIYMVVNTAWEMYLIFRQMDVYKKTTRPPNILKNIFSEEVFEKSRLYSLDLATFQAWKMFYMSSITLVTLYRQNLSSSWDFSANLAASIGFSRDGVYAVSLCFTLVNGVLSMLVALPMALYFTFVIEQKHGFNNQTLDLFLKDYLKDMMIMSVIYTIFASAVVFIIDHGGDRLYLWLWIFMLFMMIALQLIFPNFIAPLYFTFTPLEEGPLRASIQELADSIKFPLDEVFVIDGSTRSGHENAYFTGMFGIKRIVLFDTLFKTEVGRLSYDNDEIMAILCHEFGHWKHGHNYTIMAIVQVITLFSFLIFNKMMHYSPLYRAFGFAPGVEPIIIGFIIIQEYILAPYNLISGFLLTSYIRHCEFQADAFAVKMKFGKQLKTSLVKLHQNNLSFPVDDWLYAMWNFDHPTLLERTQAIDSIKTD